MRARQTASLNGDQFRVQAPLAGASLALASLDHRSCCVSSIPSQFPEATVTRTALEQLFRVLSSPGTASTHAP